MAEIKLTMDEYKALEQGLAQKKEEVDNLKKEIEGLKGFSRVIIRSRRPSSWDLSFKLHRIPLDSPNWRQRMENAVEEEIQRTPESCQYVNFDDVRQEVLNKFKDEIQEGIKATAENNQRLTKKIEEVEKKYLADHKSEIEKLDKEHVKAIKEKDEIIDKLKEELAEANKSVEDKMAEFETKKAAIEKDLEDLKAKYQIKVEKKKGWFGL